MSIGGKYSIFLRMRDDEDDFLELAANPAYALSAWSCGLDVLNGCTTLSFSVVRAASWASIEAYFAPDNIAELFLRFAGASPIRIWSGVLTKKPGRWNLPSAARKVREFEAVGFWDTLRDPGVKVLNVYDGITIQNVVKGLVQNDIAPECDVSDAVTGITTGADYTLGRAIYVDKNAGDCIKQLAETYGDVISGVDADRTLYFKDKVDPTAAPTITLQLGLDKVIGFEQMYDDSKRANHIVVNGRDRKGGAPMSVEVYDPELDTPGTTMRRITRIFSAPENATGADLYALATYYLARYNRTEESVRAVLAEAENKLADPIKLPDGLNITVEIKNESGVSVGKWPLLGVTYEMVGGTCQMTFDLGDTFMLDMIEGARLRDILREAGVLSAGELMNAVELAASVDGWEEYAYREFIRNHKMRCSWRASLESNLTALQSGEDIEAETNFGKGIGKFETPTGVTTTTSTPAYTIEIPTGVARNKFSVMRKVGFADLIAPNPADHLEKHLEQYELLAYSQSPRRARVSWRISDAGDDITPRRHYQDSPQVEWRGALLCNKPVALYHDIIWEFRWGTPEGSDVFVRRHCVWWWADERNYRQLLMTRDATNKVGLKLATIQEGTTIWVDWYAQLDAYNNDIFRVSMIKDAPPGGGPHDGCTVVIENLTRSVSTSKVLAPWWSGGLVGTSSNRCGFLGDYANTLSAGTDDWGVRRLTFGGTNYVYKTAIAISRDAGKSFEDTDVGTAAKFDPETGNMIDLGDYAGPGVQQPTAILRIGARFPQVLQAVGVGFK